MKLKKFVEYIGDLIGNDKLKTATNELVLLLSNCAKLYKSIQNSASYNDLIELTKTKTINVNDTNIQKNKIRYAILDLLREIEESTNINKTLLDEVNNELQTFEKASSKNISNIIDTKPESTIIQDTIPTKDNIIYSENKIIKEKIENITEFLGNKNISLQNITSSDIIVSTGNETNSEIIEIKQNIAQQIANLVQYISLHSDESEIVDDNFVIDDEKFDTIDFDELINAIKYGNCILFIGPDISVDSNGENLHEEFYKSISDKRRQYNEIDGFFMPGSETRLINKSKEFYSEKFHSLNKVANILLKKLAQLPFHLIVSLAPDDAIRCIYEEYNIKHNFINYTGSSHNEIEPPSKEKILIYNTLGCATDNGKYIYTHKQFNDYVKNNIDAKFPIEIENEISKDETTHYLFIGFDFNRWRQRLIMFELNLLTNIESYAFDADKIYDINKCFINQQFNMQFNDTACSDFVDILLKKSKKAGLTKSLKQIYVKNILEKLENLRIKTIDNTTLGQLTEIHKQIELMKDKIYIVS